MAGGLPFSSAGKMLKPRLVICLIAGLCMPIFEIVPFFLDIAGSDRADVRPEHHDQVTVFSHCSGVACSPSFSPLC